MNFSPALVTVEAPFEIRETLAAETLGLDPATSRVEKPIEIDVLVTKDEENYLATGWAVTSLSLVCGRCAVWMPWPIRAKVEHLFEGAASEFHRLDAINSRGYFARIAAQRGFVGLVRMAVAR